MKDSQEASYSQLLNDVTPEHLEEFKASAIAPDIIARNLRSFEPLTNPNDTWAEYELDEVFGILIDNPEHVNNGTLSGTTQQALANTLRDGGWVYEGHKGKNVKPNKPRRGKQKKVINDDLKLAIEQKFIKYESVRGKGNQQVFIPHVTARVSLLIAENLKIVGYVPSSEDSNAIDTNFWDCIIKGDYPIFITEGVKKTLSIVSNGFPVIGLNGIAGWSNGKDDDGKRLIHQELLPFLNEKREWIIAFDIDKSPKTIKAVNAEKMAFYNCIKNKVEKVTEVKWDDTYKGIDDYLATFSYPKRILILDSLNRVDLIDSIGIIADEKQADESAKEVKSSQFSSSIETGLIEAKFNDKGESKNVPIGNHLEAIARVNNPEGTDATLQLEFKTYYGSIARWSMSRGFLGGDSKDITSELLRLGYHYERGQKQALLTYLHGLGADVERTYTVTDSSGWLGNSFVLPHKTHGDESIVFLDVEPSPNAITETKGDLAGWQQHIGSPCAGNSRLIFALGVALAAPLLPVIGQESGGFHFVGTTSAGKTTTLKVAASVTGEKQLPSWRTTTNGVEATAVAHNQMLLPLDEIGQADPRQVGEVAYMLGNGQGRTRMSKNITQCKVSKWQLLFLSSGELGMREYLSQAGITQKGGQEVRFPDIPAVPFGSPFGMFETIHGADSAKEFAQNLEHACERYRGTAIDTFLARLILDRADSQFDGKLSQRVFEAASSLAEGTTDRAVSRVANRFALVQVALELAHSYGILPFAVENIPWSVKKMFGDWLGDRGGDGSIEIKQAIERIEHLLVTNEFSDRVMDLRDGDTKTIRNLLAIRRVGSDGDTEDFLVPPSVFDKEFCNGVNKTELLKELHSRGKIAEPEADGRFDRQVKINKQKKRFYILLASAFGNGEKPLGTMGTVGTTPQTHTGARFEKDNSVPNEKNDLGTVGTDSTENNKGTHGTQGENGLGYESCADKNVAEKRSQASVPTVPTVPIEKQDFPKNIEKNTEILREVPEGEF
jgi:putative DNA primase/helicase